MLALLAASEIARMRNGQALPNRVHFLDSLKRPEEVETLRRIYGHGFFLIGTYAPESDRKAYLLNEKDLSSDEADKLVKRDQNEVADHFGQRTRETFQLADAFVRLTGGDINSFQRDVRRFVDLVFGDPFITPTRDEHAMFLAYAASLRSADLSRQVGAVVVSEAGEVIATGANDVPRCGGGLYWPGAGDDRDYVRGVDSNKQEIEKIVDEIVSRVVTDGNRVAGEELERRLTGTRLHDLTEFGRIVHAEMEALSSCARIGVSPRNGTLYTTTFPCHNCAKHIVACGVREVQYVEPYPKSKAWDLHGDSVAVDEPQTGKVSFVPFVGVTARRYVDLFSMRLSTGRRMIRKGPDGLHRADFVRSKAAPRIPLSTVSYIEREIVAARDILNTIGTAEKKRATKTARAKRNNGKPK